MTERLLTLALYLVLLAVSIAATRQHRQAGIYIGWIAVAVHGILFYAVNLSDRSFNEIIQLSVFGLPPTQTYNLWSTLLRCHSILTAIFTLGGVWWGEREKRYGP